MSFAFCPLAKREFVVLRGTLHEQHHQQQDEMPDQQRHVQQTPGHRFQGSTRFKVGSSAVVPLAQHTVAELHDTDNWLSPGHLFMLLQHSRVCLQHLEGEGYQVQHLNPLMATHWFLSGGQMHFKYNCSGCGQPNPAKLG